MERTLRYIVYFDGMTDVITSDQFAANDWHEGWSGPFTADSELFGAAHHLVLDPLSGEIAIEKSVGWHLRFETHPFIAGTDARYCSAQLPSSHTCDKHARFHLDAPDSLKATRSRSLFACHNARRDADGKPPTCDAQEATTIVSDRAYCERCACALASASASR